MLTKLVLSPRKISEVKLRKVSVSFFNCSNKSASHLNEKKLKISFGVIALKYFIFLCPKINK